MPSSTPVAKDARAEAQRIAGKSGGLKKGSSFAKIIVIATVLIVCVIAVVLVLNSNKANAPADSGAVPVGGNEHGGITLVNLEAFPEATVPTINAEAYTPGSPGADPENPASAAPRPAAKNTLVLYADTNCVHCASFEAEYGTALKKWVEQGYVDLEVRMVGYLDAGSPTNYSSRAANALTCTAANGPETYLDFMQIVFDRQEAGEMTNRQLVDIGHGLGADIESCVNDGTYRPFVKATTAMAQSDGVNGTPMVFMNGKHWADGNLDTWIEENLEPK